VRASRALGCSQASASPYERLLPLRLAQERPDAQPGSQSWKTPPQSGLVARRTSPA
jgi:hypothetical protein